MSNYHVYPAGDLVAHETNGEDCVCIPRVEAVATDSGGTNWLYVHHSLDGRELRETTK